MAQSELNTTSFLILGVLANRDYSAYEIAAQVGAGLGELWPLVERQRYNVPKRLVEKGMVTARTEANGKRTRTIYSITPAGRKALRTWLSTEVRPATMAFEGMIRVLVAEQGSVDDLRANLEAVRDQAIASRSLFVGHAEVMREHGATAFPERRHLLTLANRFMLDHFGTIIEWADWALAETEAWPDTASPATTDAVRIDEILDESIVRGRDEVGA